LVGAIKQVARNVEPPFGVWHKSRFAFEAFRAAVLALLDLHRPGGMPERPADNEIADMYLGKTGRPKRQAGCLPAELQPLPGYHSRGSVIGKKGNRAMANKRDHGDGGIDERGPERWRLR
jgi:integrase